jgi:hypothetical protein
MGWVKNVSSVFTGSGQRAAGNAAADSLRELGNQAAGYLDPYNKAGQTALSPLTGLLTGNQYDPTTGKTTAIDQNQRMNLFQQSPGYQFSLDQALKGIQASQAARGNLLSGGGQKEIAEFASGYASQNSNDYINQLFQLAGGGQQAAQGQANAISNIAVPLSQANYMSGIAGQQAGANLLSFGASMAGQQAGGGGGMQSQQQNSGGGQGTFRGGLSQSYGGQGVATSIIPMA